MFPAAHSYATTSGMTEKLSVSVIFPSYTADEYITISRHFGSVQYHTLIFQATV